ncbi:DUF4340 domain-containing protein [Flavonifractor hominis]|uniref:DUF4340 domain-containing protein n=1 Tax=Flavonifractor hominis TaxID=3133178 RepID=A0ABV1ER95_9FIRM
MKRYKRIYLLLAVLVVACAVTFGVSRYQEHKEQISNSDQVVLEIPTDSVQSLSWEYDGQSLAFHREDGVWVYDEDAAFPVDEDKMSQMLERFASFGVAFIIEEVEDLGQYGLDDPVCTIEITTEEQNYTVQLGDYSTMDSQRYVSIGDGNVYLVQDDPLDDFDAQLSDLIAQDDVPYFEQANQITFSGSENYTITYEEDGADTYRDSDVYFTEVDGDHVPLDTSRVNSYLKNLSYLDLTHYVTYNATEEAIQGCGLDDPELIIQVNYTTEDEEGNESTQDFTLSVSRDPDQLAELAEQSGETDEEEDPESITAYARVGESQILYQITGEEYQQLMAAAYDDLRHPEVVPAETEDISQIDITLEGVAYTITSEGSGEERTYSYQEQELDLTDLESALQALQADRFTDEEPTQKQEISLTLHLDLEGEPTVSIELYRYDGSDCLAVVDGQPVCLVARSSVVELIEAINAIVLN